MKPEPSSKLFSLLCLCKTNHLLRTSKGPSILVKYSLAILIAAYKVFSSGDNLDLILYENEKSCGGSAGICHGTSHGECCFQPGELWGSGLPQGGTAPVKANLYTKQGEKLLWHTIYCASANPCLYGLIPAIISTRNCRLQR